jgi:ectoine hydroxylase-related dioxygenase (phytanoyl-CoA dioxygenase family)
MVSATAVSEPIIERTDRYPVTVQQYIAYRRDGFLVVRDLVPANDIEELRRHTEDLMQGRLPEQQRQMKPRDLGQDRGVTMQELEEPPAHLSPQEKAQHFLRIHMLHRKLALHERYMLHPRVLDVVEVLIGPDVLALQTMLFLKPPGKPGQGWHQDSYYIPTHPDTLIGAWIAIDDCDETNGAMWFAKGSGHEPVYPPCPEIGQYGFGNRLLSDIAHVKGVSDTDDARNTLAKVADGYDQVLASARAGDVVFFNGHVLHRSKQNWTSDHFRRSFVSHYCNARSFTQWGADLGGADEPKVRPTHDALKGTHGMTNGSHILARGDSHLPFAQPKFATPCAATLPPEERKRAGEQAARIIAGMNNGLMGCAITEPERDDDKE